MSAPGDRARSLAALGVVVEDPASTLGRGDGARRGRRDASPVHASRRADVGARGAVIGPFARLVDAEIGPGRRDPRSLPARDTPSSRRARPSGPSRTCARRAASARGAKVGNFVEVKKTRSARARRPTTSRTSATPTSAPASNVGGGTITCNYDGVHKHARRASGPAPSSAATRIWSHRSRSAKAPTSPRARPSRRTCPPARSPWRAGAPGRHRGLGRPQRQPRQAGSTLEGQLSDAPCAESSATSAAEDARPT